MRERQKQVRSVRVVILVMVFSLVLSLPVIPQERVDGAAAVGGLGCIIPDQNVAPSYDFAVSHARLRAAGVGPVPASVDWSSRMPPAGDQGTQGSCVAWATAYAYKSYHEGVEQGWNLATADHQFSPAFTYNQVNGGTENGSSIGDALNLFKTKGCDTLSVFPYNQNDYTTQPNADQLQRARPFEIQSWSFLANDGRWAESASDIPDKGTLNWTWQGTALTDRDIANLKAYLASGDIFVFSMSVFDSFYDDYEAYMHTVPYVAGSQKLYGGHAATIVGYDDTMYGGSFKMLNSWGTDWGTNGYKWMTYEYFEQCVDAAYAMTDRSPDFNASISNLSGKTAWPAGDQATVAWTTSDAGGGSGVGINQYSVDFSSDGGTSWTPLGTTSVSPCTVTVPNQPSQNCKVRVKAIGLSASDSTVLSTATSAAFSVVSVSPVISTVSPLATGTVDQSYIVSFQATGGTAPYAWSMVSGTLPAGLSLSSTGTLSGIPSAAGDFLFRIRATDSAPQTGEKDFALHVAAAVATGTLVINATLNGTVWTGSVMYNLTGASSFSGTTVSHTLSSTPSDSYTLGYVSGGPAGAAFSSITPSATQTLTAGGTTTFTLNFTSSIYTLTTTTSPSSGGTITRSPDAASYAPGTVVTLTATPASGYTFTGWSGDLSGTTNPGAITMDANKTVTATFTLTPAITPSDSIGVFRPSTNGFYLRSSGGTVSSPIFLGDSGDKPIIGDWDGDGIDEIGVYRPSNSAFYLRSSGGTVSSPIFLGDSDDEPIIGDWDGDGIDEIGVYRPSNSAFYLRSSDGTVSSPIFLGDSDDEPIIGDWDGNGTDEIGIFRPSTNGFYLRSSTGTVSSPIFLGNSDDEPIIGDWDGNGTDEIGIFRPSTSGFYLRTGTTVAAPIYLGDSGDKPIIGMWS